MGTVAISGTTGLIGHAVAARLGSRHQVWSLGRGAGSTLNVDFANPASITAVSLRGADAVVHCAGVTDEDFRADPAKAFGQATLGMSALVARAVQDGVRQFAYVSSAHVYGPFVGTIDEASPPNPLSDYAIAHFASEQILRRAVHEQFRAAVLRPCAVFGIPPDLKKFRRWQLIPFDFPRCAIMEGEIRLKSSGLADRNFVGTEDIAATIERWLDPAGSVPSFSVINPIGRESMSVLDFAKLCARLSTERFARACRVTAPEGTAGPAFTFASRDPKNTGTMDLSATLVELMAQLVATPPT